MKKDYQLIMLKLNEKDRDYGFEYSTNGFEDAINYAGIEIFNSEYTDSYEYYNLNNDQFIKYIYKKTKNIINEISESI